MVIRRVSGAEHDIDLKQGRITAFLRWWGGELLALLPARLAFLLGLARESVLLAPEGDDFTVQRLLGGAALPMGVLRQAEVRDQVTRHRAAGAECVLRIPLSQGLRRQASIAVSTLPRGFDAVAGEIERQTPFTLNQVYLGYRIEKVIDARGRVTAHLALVPCASANVMLRNLAASGIAPDRITLEDDAGLNSAGDTVHILTSLRARPPARFLMAAVCIVLLAALVSPYWRNAAALSRVQKELALARQEVVSASDQKNRAGDAQSQLAWLVEQRAQRPSTLVVLNAISAALPDTAYLAQFELAGQTLALEGVAAAAPELIAPLEALPLIEKVEFSAPTLRDPVQGREQFQISLQLRKAAEPEPGK